MTKVVIVIPMMQVNANMLSQHWQDNIVFIMAINGYEFHRNPQDKQTSTYFLPTINQTSVNISKFGDLVHEAKPLHLQLLTSLLRHAPKGFLIMKTKEIIHWYRESCMLWPQ